MRGGSLRFGQAALAFACMAAFALRAEPLPAAPPAAAASMRPAPVSFEALLDGFEGMAGFEARFEEEKTLALLSVPLESRGRLYFAPPATLLRQVEAPRATEILVTGNSVRISDGDTEQLLDLSANPEARPLVESILWLLAGDREAIERTYQADYTVEGGERWQLRLQPRSAPLDQLVRELRIGGVGVTVERIELLEPSGDRTLTRILDANVDRHFDSEERSRLFGATAR